MSKLKSRSVVIHSVSGITVTETGNGAILTRPDGSSYSTVSTNALIKL